MPQFFQILLISGALTGNFQQCRIAEDFKQRDVVSPRNFIPIKA